MSSGEPKYGELKDEIETKYGEPRDNVLTEDVELPYDAVEVPLEDIEPFIKGEIDRVIKAVTELHEKIIVSLMEEIETLAKDINFLKSRLDEIESILEVNRKGGENGFLWTNEQIKAIMAEITKEEWTEALCPNCVGGDPGCLVCGGMSKIKIKLKDLPEG